MGDDWGIFLAGREKNPSRSGNKSLLVPDPYPSPRSFLVSLVQALENQILDLAIMFFRHYTMLYSTNDWVSSGLVLACPGSVLVYKTNFALIYLLSFMLRVSVDIIW